MMSRQEWVGAGVGVAAICVTIGVSSGSTNARIDDLRTDFRANIQDVRADLRELRNDVDGLRADVGNLRHDVDGLRGDVDSLRTDVEGVRGEVDGLRSDVNLLNRLLVEHTAGHEHSPGSR